MSCVICRHGTLHEGLSTVVLTRNETTVIIKGVPSRICENCGEYYLSQEITEKLYGLAAKAVEAGAEVEIIRFAA